VIATITLIISQLNTLLKFSVEALITSVLEIVNFGSVSRHVLETVQDRATVTTEPNENWLMYLQLYCRFCSQILINSLTYFCLQ